MYHREASTLSTRRWALTGSRVDAQHASLLWQKYSATGRRSRGEFGQVAVRREEKTIDRDAYLDVLQRDSEKVVTAARIGLDVPVPSCPGWDVAFLLFHLGAVHRSQTYILRQRSSEPPGFRPEIFQSAPALLEWFEQLRAGTGAPTPPEVGLVTWFEDGASELIAALRDTDPDEPMWSWSTTQRAAHYLRMMPLETALHRWDAQLSHGREEPIDPDLAQDGIDHNFDVMLPMRRSQAPPPAGEGETFAFVSEDGLGEWLIRFQGAQVLTGGDVARADVTVRGTASDLLLFLWHRLPPHVLHVAGNTGLLERYFELVPPL